MIALRQDPLSGRSAACLIRGFQPSIAYLLSTLCVHPSHAVLRRLTFIKL